ncbi:hypothetical protein DES40_1453 [Litorimonas taeanensis]|uniref:Integral membrane protein n=1 Tax=Litorimonas taeanensis TaxID=568099 RepID=A0A420WMJ1_9PROT|nr:hypothetical protein [Litorimonas taeanensis]RKQ72116.1 hypothetical protein DES40_1453 [Litorimonas taeanensis]
MLVYTYMAYISLSLTLTIWVGRKLNVNGRIFLLENYGDKPVLADAINQMLLVGFYLINIGFIAYTMQIFDGVPMNWAEVLEFLSVKIGFMSIVLGVLHFSLMFALQQYSKIGFNTKVPA